MLYKCSSINNNNVFCKHYALRKMKMKAENVRMIPILLRYGTQKSSLSVIKKHLEFQRQYFLSS